MEDASAKIVEAQLRAPVAKAISRRYVDAGATLELVTPDRLSSPAWASFTSTGSGSFATVSR
ncbi:hypothetical protein [Nannocystis punicea]|uniref:Uncharacterized protein n=1 Tax=Nannocystis punicea TaxID=2995304 RepID=A0ABY7HHP9_9BACT|nr:hypothetical protein [Nannocystis poenicansa]WAS98835.1 hypothetical protein O0S08_22115 [Nannocystis poenicansa]